MKIGILGATGAVGRQMLDCLIEQEIPVDDLVLLASKKSAGQIIKFKDKDYEVKEVNHDSFKGLDVVLGASSNEVAKQYKDDIVKVGAVFIDNSSAFRMDDDVPLIVPEINGNDVKKHKGVISNPNCSTIITLMAINAINKLSKVKVMIASTYQAVSGAGKGGIDELNNEINDIDYKPSVFPYTIAYNCIPCIGSLKDNLYTSEEMKMENEGKKILHNDDLRVTCTCVRVPVLRSHCISVSLKCERALSVTEVREALSKEDGVILYDDVLDNKYPMPLVTSNQDKVYVGRIREDRVLEGGISLFCSGDQIRKGAASNAVGIIKCLYED
ncbi:MAG: aspartate-semialdehyde dehydrogenase [Erysipelotrichaceae bacterium]|nr:aspartate-semialdehyde dehydrogenase [Solobacterium sp.]MDY3795040.1 aspartate-semialdehyde dehydrogenase [Erysipelotrichaceae bacterium]MDY4792027.1 aspartate-semialdehyde dehydrogenase [Erysipelotrichaceae bacterium]